MFFRYVILFQAGISTTTLPGFVICTWQPRREFNCKSAAMSGGRLSSSSMGERFSAPSFIHTWQVVQAQLPPQAWSSGIP